jgi:TRAP-type C4-dicarboxylate transport system substrate-binding protein
MVQEEAIRALGATPVEVVGAFREDAMAKGEIQALQLEIGTYRTLGAAAGRAKYVTTNMVLWPNVGVLIANPDRLASMTAEQRAWLQQAAADALAFSERSGGHEQQEVRPACDAGARFATASERDLEAMRHAFAGVYAGIEADPQASGYLQQIEELERGTPDGSALEIPAGCRWSPS